MAAHGITPAWAGKSPFPSGSPRMLRDHPRMGGEKQDGHSQAPWNWGSPPRGRGKGQFYDESRVYRRITPAWAGKRTVFVSQLSAVRDHPRVGGEKIWAARLAVASRGSPPHRRGKAKRPPRLLLPAGITPAQAGKRDGAAAMAAAVKDHPRVGGEKILEPSMGVGNFGSPPHGRGKVQLDDPEGGDLRITPAWAGKSPASQPWSPPLWMMVIRPRP